jgi:hypothetical protein
LDTTRFQPAIDEPPLEPRKREAPGQGTNLYRSPARVGILSFVGFVTYPIWWLSQLFKFTRREGFPRAKAFWWILVPFYGFVVIWQQLDDLKHAAASKKIRVRSGLVIWLLAIGFFGPQLTRLKDDSLTFGVAVILLSTLLMALGIYLGQRYVVAYLAATYPTEHRRRVSRGEIVATLLTLVLLVATGGLGYYSGYPETGPAVTYLPAAIPVAGVTLSGGWNQYRDGAAGFSIQLPPDWASVAYDTVARGLAPTRQMKFYAEANDKISNLAIRRRVTGQMSLDELAADRQASLERIGAGEISLTRVTLPAGQAELIKFAETFPYPSGSVTDHFIEYLIVRHEAFRTTAYRITFGTDTFSAAMEATVWSIITTFRVL